MVKEFTSRQVKTSKLTLWQAASAVGLPAAMWRLPNEKQVFLAISAKEKPLSAQFEAFKEQSGFAISPFQNSDQTVFIEADYFFAFNENQETISTDGLILKLPRGTEFDLLTRAEASFQAQKSQAVSIKSVYDESVFMAMVTEAVEAIKAGEMQKVVLSRTKEVTLSEDFEVVKAFEELCAAYPNAFISAVALPHLNQVWMGASPEILVSQNQAGIFRTMALAGTQTAFDENQHLMTPAEASWKQKEIEEQAYVSRYIIDCFKKIRLREFKEEGPKTVVAGNLMHLRTDFYVDTVAVNMPELLEVMLLLLNPTSAVCGMPKAPATDFILQTERHQRSFYSGYLGPVNVNQQTHLFVNLRTMMLKNGIATLFAGCGITENSNPKREWQETEMKCQTMLKVLG